ncbi:hypothetical protein HETIRDRAFT_430263 [Heterobasidion irregulare TC 32-1]|uniref:BHLH domain-containing protein n=1 Tax=Heterobasidion irregulare (strain TC 32-1) TaxID=747525 RepID=W4JQG1_HETIT|nr:uncharacterized protein HETIRDRAFT_430263 [Heterobasidion irregulare TC 32-1]ETW75724.1 hypothetical protein HETIRDRAFT_430263 [Heterobasidion irregulare TC 32-1]
MSSRRRKRNGCRGIAAAAVSTRWGASPEPRGAGLRSGPRACLSLPAPGGVARFVCTRGCCAAGFARAVRWARAVRRELETYRCMYVRRAQIRAHMRWRPGSVFKADEKQGVIFKRDPIASFRVRDAQGHRRATGCGGLRGLYGRKAVYERARAGTGSVGQDLRWGGLGGERRGRSRGQGWDWVFARDGDRGGCDGGVTWGCAGYAGRAWRDERVDVRAGEEGWRVPDAPRVPSLALPCSSSAPAPAPSPAPAPAPSPRSRLSCAAAHPSPSMSFFPASAYKPQIRQEGFHLPSPPPSNPSPPPNNNPNSANPSGGAFDPALFMPHFLSDPYASRKDHAAQSGPSMDFGDELASLMAHSPPPPPQHHHQSHERSTHSPDTADPHHASNPNGNGYDSGYRHNIFDISAPSFSASSHHHHPSASSHNPFSLHRDLPSLAHPASFDPYTANPPQHFNATLPALSSSLRYDPHDPSAPSSVSNNNNNNSNGNGNGSSNGGPPSSYHGLDYRTHHTPSPVGALPPHHHPAHRSRSRSRDTGMGMGLGVGIGAIEPPSTHGGPARTTRAKRGSISSSSPPRAHAHHHHHPPHAILIPGARASSAAGSIGGGGGGSTTTTPTLPVSPLSLHALSVSGSSSWFGPAPASANGHGGHAGHHAHHASGEYSLPTPESLGGFAGFGGGGGGGMGVSPKELGSLGGSMGGMGESPGAGLGHVGVGSVGSGGADPVSKQALLANEKRRRRRESHNAVERRRRDNINEKISELATLIPEALLDPGAAATPTSPTAEDVLFGNLSPIASASAAPGASGSSASPKDEDGTPGSAPAGSSAAASAASAAAAAAAADGAVKANKGMILRKSVDYIRYLQQLVSAQATRNRELEAQLQGLRQSHSPQSHSHSHSHSQARAGSKDGEGDMILHEEIAARGRGHGHGHGHGHGRSGKAARGKRYRGELAGVVESAEGEGEGENDESGESAESAESGGGRGADGAGEGEGEGEGEDVDAMDVEEGDLEMVDGDEEGSASASPGGMGMDEDGPGAGAGAGAVERGRRRERERGVKVKEEEGGMRS